MPRVALAKRVHANAVDNLLASTEVFPMTAPAPKGRLGNGQLRLHKDAVRDRRPFSPRTGLPEAEATGARYIPGAQVPVDGGLSATGGQPRSEV